MVANSEETNEEEVNEIPLDHRCMINCLQPLSTLPAFTLCLGAFGLSYGMLLTYFVSQLTTLEQIFGFSSQETGWMISCYEIGHIVAVVFVGYFGHTAHRPRLLGIGALVVGACGALMALPNFMSFELSRPDEDKVAYNRTAVYTYQSICADRNVSSDDGKTGICPEMSSLFARGSHNTPAFILFATAFAIAGVGPTTLWTLGISYIDDNAIGKSSSFYVSIMFSLRTLAPVAGFLFGSLTSSLYIDLSSTDYKPGDAEWFGAWWLGFIIIGTMTMLSAIPLFLFPRKYPGSRAADESTPDKTRKTLKEIVTGLLQAIWRLLTNPAFMLITVAITLEGAAGHGFSAYLPKYIEVQFQQPSNVANFLTGIALALTAAIGVALSGFITSRIPWGLRRTTFWGCIISTIGLVFSVLLFFFGCPNEQMSGIQPNSRNFIPNVGALSNSRCNQNCDCTINIYEPVCGNGQIYYSPCFAGCSLKTENGFSDCNCISGNGTVTGDVCVSNCHTLTPYLFIVFLFVFTTSFGTMPWIMFSLRCIEPRDKSLAMGIISLAVAIVLIPVPALYGASIDATCMVQRPEQTCGSDQTRCLLYDNSSFRFTLHILSFAIEFFSPIFMFLAWYISRNQPLYGEDDEANKRDEEDSDTKSVNIAIISNSLINDSAEGIDNPVVVRRKETII
ncbi:solute carrier organic anion transporter family member 2A1-like [Tubulanus polymorphus]|uniref:solute carrier organic anion transporter family member 2A1-like n=1 Tax=Tubulanus polymorphus TaxID=672921 RepID=UPI003DA2BF25